MAEGSPNETGLTEGTPRETKLAEGVPIVLKETDGRLIEPRVGTGIPTYSTLTETSWGGFPGTVETLPPPPLLSACNTDSTDEVRRGGCPAGTVTAVVLATGTVTDGIRIGFAEMRRASSKGRRLERYMIMEELFLWQRKEIGRLWINRACSHIPSDRM